MNERIAADSRFNVSPESVIAYLQKRGWQQVGSYGDVETYWTDGGVAELAIPAREAATDTYAVKMAQIIRNIADTERVPEAYLVRWIRFSTRYQVRLSQISTPVRA